MPREFTHSGGVETYSYWEHVSNAASVQAWGGIGPTPRVKYTRKGKPSQEVYPRENQSPLLSAETIPENESVLDFKTFAQEYPDRLFPLLADLRLDFQEPFIEYYFLGKSQSFLAAVYGKVQTRVWQSLRIIEQALGARIVLGANPGVQVLEPILRKAQLDHTEFGSLARLIVLYAQTQNYAAAAKAVGAPIPAIRKLFLPAIHALCAARDVRAVAVGAYLRGLTHQNSRKGKGLDSRHLARAKRMKIRRFTAPALTNLSPTTNAALLTFGDTTTLHTTPWLLFELHDHEFLPTSSKQAVDAIYPSLETADTIEKDHVRIFENKAMQIFIPTDDNGNLKLGYFFARSTTDAGKKPWDRVRHLTRIRGVSEMAAVYDGENFVSAPLVPDAVVQPLIKTYSRKPSKVRIGSFVEILTGEAEKYCGTVTKNTGKIKVTVAFPSGRRFLVTAEDASAVRVIPNVPAERRAFWGEQIILSQPTSQDAEQTPDLISSDSSLSSPAACSKQ